MSTAISAGGEPNVAEELFHEALKICNAHPELDPRKHPEVLDEFAKCKSTPEGIMLALDKRMEALNDLRSGRWAILRQKLKPAVEVTLLLTKVVGDAAQVIVHIYPLLPFALTYNLTSYRAFLVALSCSRPSVFC
jgi:hypothetical protein